MTDEPARRRSAPRAGTARPPRPRRAVLLSLFAGFAVFAYVFDQLTKLWVTSTMVEGERIPVLPPAAALVLHPQLRRRVLHRRERHLGVHDHHGRRSPSPSCSSCASSARPGGPWRLGLLLGGALGNLTDRLFREPSFAMGHVVDFIQLPNFAIFNIADSAVVSAVVIICLLTLRGIALDGSRARARARHSRPDSRGAEDAGERAFVVA